VDATLGLPILTGLIAVALLFDFLNGLHDAANSIATIVSTRVLRPQYAVFWAAFFNFVAFSAYLHDLAGQVMAMFVLTVAAAEAAIGLAILVVYFRNRGSIAVEDVNVMKG